MQPGLRAAALPDATAPSENELRRGHGDLGRENRFVISASFLAIFCLWAIRGVSLPGFSIWICGIQGHTYNRASLSLQTYKHVNGWSETMFRPRIVLLGGLSMSQEDSYGCQRSRLWSGLQTRDQASKQSSRLAASKHTEPDRLGWLAGGGLFPTCLSNNPDANSTSMSKLGQYSRTQIHA